MSTVKMVKKKNISEPGKKSLKDRLVTFKNWFVKTSLIVKILIVLVLIGLGWFGYKKISSTSSQKSQYQTSSVERGTIVSTISASGKIISSNITNITTQASGTVKKVYVNDGDKVYKGQKLAEVELDPTGAQNYASAYSSYISAVVGMNSANNSYRSAQASADVVLDAVKGHDTDETLAQKEQRTKAEVSRDNAYDGLKTAQARLNSAVLDYQIASSSITSPVAGIVKSVTIAEGMNLGAAENASGGRTDQRVATIGTEGFPLGTFSVSEIDVSKIKPGQKVTISIDSITDSTFTGKVVSVDRVGTTSNNVTTYPAIVQFDTTSEEILPNMAATANIIIDTKADILLAPSTAIQSQNGQYTARVLRNGKEESQAVEIGISSDTQIEILSGLSEGDVVITGTVATTTSTQSTSIFGGGFGGAGVRSSGGAVRIPRD
jgi:RND family efflux transporter MFP subunit